MMVITLSSVALIWCGFMLLLVKRSGWFQPAVAFLVMAMVDVLLPAIYWVTERQVTDPEWLTPLTEEQLLNGLLFYVLFFVIFIVSVVIGGSGGSGLRALPPFSEKLEQRVLIVACLLVLMNFVQIFSDIAGKGGVQQWFWAKFVFSTLNEVGENSNSGRSVLGLLPFRELLQATAGVGFFYRKKFRHHFVFGRFLPLLIVLFAALTFLRGALIACALTIVFAEWLRFQLEGKGAMQTQEMRSLALAIFVIFATIYTYGSFRDSLRGIASGLEETEDSRVPVFLTAGHGLLGVSHIVEEYGGRRSFLMGQTYIDMLLLPVPRAIYTSKPDWYGIDDITRGMGWPETTQSAVTMPGEAYANFGILGMLVALPLGFFFGLLKRLMISSYICFLMVGPVIFFQMPAVTNWMSFTGLMNSVPLLALLVGLVLYIGAAAKAGAINKT